MVSVRNDDEMVKSQLNDDEVCEVGLMMVCVGVVVMAAKEIMITANMNDQAKLARSLQDSLDRLRK